jgi:hypothetical protein
MEKPSLSQLSSLNRVLQNNKEHYGIYKLDEVGVSDFEKMTLKQYNYLLFCIFNKKPFKAKEILDNFLTKI